MRIAFNNVSGSVSFSRKPEAPAVIAAITYSSKSNVVAHGNSTASSTSDSTYTDPELDELTDREREVLIEIAHGLSNQEIADKLFISLPTVKTHVAHILAKINARDRVQAVVFAYENHLV